MNIKLAFLVFCFCGIMLSQEKVTGNSGWDFASQENLPSTDGKNLSVNISATSQNPFVNGLFSLAIPGSGQFRTERYTKSALFITAEAVLIIYAIISNKKGDDKTKEYQRYADLHWSALRYANWINVHGVTDYGPNISFSPSDLAAVANNDFSKINEWERGLHRSGISHTLPAYGDQQYYELIGKYHQFKYGWDTYPQVNGIPISDGGSVDALIPQQLKDYAAERGKANDYYYAVSFASSALLINHVISAIDSYLSTISYNREITATFGVKQIDSFEGKRLHSEMKLSIGL